MRTLIHLALICVAAFLGGFVAETVGSHAAAQEVPKPKAPDAAESIRVKQLVVVDAENKPKMTLDGSQGTLVLHDAAGKGHDLILGRIFDDGVGLACGVDGKIRAFFAASKKTSGFMIADAKENILMEAHVSADGKANAIMFSDPDTRKRALIGTDESGNGRIQFFAKDQKERMAIRQQIGSVTMVLNDPGGDKRLMLSELDGFGADVSVFDEKKVVRGSLFITENTGPRVTIFDAAGKPRESLPATKNTQGTKE